MVLQHIGINGRDMEVTVWLIKNYSNSFKWMIQYVAITTG